MIVTRMMTVIIIKIYRTIFIRLISTYIYFLNFLLNLLTCERSTGIVSKLQNSNISRLLHYCAGIIILEVEIKRRRYGIYVIKSRDPWKGLLKCFLIFILFFFFFLYRAKVATYSVPRNFQIFRIMRNVRFYLRGVYSRLFGLSE